MPSSIRGRLLLAINWKLNLHSYFLFLPPSGLLCVARTKRSSSTINQKFNFWSGWGIHAHFFLPSYLSLGGNQYSLSKATTLAVVSYMTSKASLRSSTSWSGDDNVLLYASNLVYVLSSASWVHRRRVFYVLYLVGRSHEKVRCHWLSFLLSPRAQP